MENRKKRNSILKVRQTVDVLAEIEDNSGPSGTTTTTNNRRVSFQNVKHVKQYDRDLGKMCDATPIKEKITDTLGSDGILTPRGGNMDNTNVQLDEHGSFQVFGAGGGAHNTHGEADMSLESTQGGGAGGGGAPNDTARLFNVTREKTIVYERITTERIVVVPQDSGAPNVASGASGAPSGAPSGALNDTLSLFNQTNHEEVDMSMDHHQQRKDDTMAIFNQTNTEEIDMSMDETHGFAVPKLMPRHHLTKNQMNKTMNETMPMDVVEEEEGLEIGKKGNETMSLFNVTNPEAMDMDITQTAALAPTSANDTLALFRSPAPKKKTMTSSVAEDVEPIDMDITTPQRPPSELGSQVMDISVAPTPRGNNSTLKLFESHLEPEKDTKEQDMSLEKTIQAPPPQSTEAIDMDISQLPKSPEEHPQNQSIDMDITVEKAAASETMALFQQSPARSKTPSANETLKMFQSPARGNEKMRMPGTIEKTKMFDDDSMDISIAPPTPKAASEDVSKSKTPKPAEKTKVFEDDSMDISVAPPTPKAVSEPKTPGTTEKTKVFEDDGMDISVAPPTPKAVSKDVSEPKTPGTTEKTKMFEDDGMNISVAPPTPKAVPEDVHEPKTPKSAEKTKVLEDDGMDISVQPPTPKSTPEDSEDVEDSDDVEELQKTLHDNSSMMISTETSVLEAGRAVHQTSMMEVYQEDVVETEGLLKHQTSFVVQNTSICRPSSGARDVSSLNNDSITLDVSAKNDSMLKTMQLTDDVDVTRTLNEDSDDVEKMEEEEEEKTLTEKSEPSEVPEDVTQKIQEETVVEERTIGFDNMSSTRFSYNMSMSTTTQVLNQSASASRRRRSLLREPSLRESPRRLALENSMMSMLQQPSYGGDALSEYRQNKMNTTLEHQQQMMLNESVQNTSTGSIGGGGRDIFAMNTSIRSPHHITQKNASFNMNTPRVPSPLAFEDSPAPPHSTVFQMPDFDPAVVNVIYLTPEDPDAAPFPESLEFQKLVDVEASRMQKEIQTILENSEDVGGLLEKKLNALRAKDMSKLTSDERDVVMEAREEAELYFLELRLKFAEKTLQNQRLQIEKREAENAEKAEQIRDAKNLPAIKKKLDEMKACPTRAERRQIRKEYMEVKKAVFDLQMERLKKVQNTIFEIGNQREELQDELYGLGEQLAQLEEQKRREKAAIMELVMEIYQQW